MAIGWTVEHASQPSPPLPLEKKPSPEEDSLLLGAIDFVEEKLAAAAGLVDTEDAHALAERARALRGAVEDWQAAPPTEELRDRITGKVLGLHVALSRMLRGEKK